MSGVGFNLSQSLKQQQTLAPQMRQGLKMLQMTSLELRAELQHAMETNPVIEDVTSRIERQMSRELPESHTYGEVTEKPLDFSTDGEMAKVLGTEATDDGYRDYFLGNMESASGDEEAQSRRDHLFDSMVKTETLQQHLMGTYDRRRVVQPSTSTVFRFIIKWFRPRIHHRRIPLRRLHSLLSRQLGLGRPASPRFAPRCTSRPKSFRAC